MKCFLTVGTILLCNTTLWGMEEKQAISYIQHIHEEYRFNVLKECKQQTKPIINCFNENDIFYIATIFPHSNQDGLEHYFKSLASGIEYSKFRRNDTNEECYVMSLCQAENVILEKIREYASKEKQNNLPWYQRHAKKVSCCMFGLGFLTCWFAQRYQVLAPYFTSEAIFGIINKK